MCCPAGCTMGSLSCLLAQCMLYSSQALSSAGIREQQVLKGFALLDIVQQLHPYGPSLRRFAHDAVDVHYCSRIRACACK